MYIYLSIYIIIRHSFRVFSLELFLFFYCWQYLICFCKDFPGKDFPHFYNQIKEKTGNRLLPLSSRITHLWKLFNQTIHFQNTRIHFRITYAWHGFISPTIFTYIIWMKILLGNKLNHFCLDTLCFFVLSFVSIWVKELKYFCFIETALFWLYIYIPIYVLWNSYQLPLLLLIRKQCLISSFHLDYSLIPN